MIVQFADVRVDVAARRISKASVDIHLTRKAFELLILLLERRPDVVLKEQIYTRLWPDSFVSESSLQALVSEIRHAIGDDGKRQQWLRTVHGVGYAFRGEAQQAAGRSDAATQVRAWLVAGALKVPLQGGENTLGRSGDDVTVIEASTISRRHARIVVGEESWVEDLGSKNGTWLRDEPVSGPTPLREGDPLRLGSLLFTFRYSRGVDSTDTMSRSAAS